MGVAVRGTGHRRPAVSVGSVQGGGQLPAPWLGFGFGLGFANPNPNPNPILTLALALALTLTLTLTLTRAKVAANYPPMSTGATCRGPQPVAAHAPQGDSPFGVSDLVGNVWQYTDEVRDEHTRAVILRGGSNYRPSGSKWYFPNQIELNTHNKYFLFSDRYERAATIGVRCVKDAA